MISAPVADKKQAAGEPGEEFWSGREIACGAGHVVVWYGKLKGRMADTAASGRESRRWANAADSEKHPRAPYAERHTARTPLQTDL